MNDQVACESNATYGGPGFEGKNPDGNTWYTIRSMSTCATVELKKGDKIFFQANYDVEKHPARQNAHGGMAEGMALVTAFFVGKE